MLARSQELNETNEVPLVSICLIADAKGVPANFTPITKCWDDGSDADLWKDSFGFGIFNRTVRYLAVSRAVPENSAHEVITDLAIITEKEAVPTNFTCVDYTADTKERALKKKFICVRLTPRNDALDALTDIIVLGKNKRPPKGYTSAGEVDGALICFKVQTIAESYGVRQRTPALPSSLYPNLAPSTHNSMPDMPNIAACSIRTVSSGHPVQNLDGVEFKLNSRLVSAIGKSEPTQDPVIPDNYDHLNYNFSLERSILSSN